MNIINLKTICTLGAITLFFLSSCKDVALDTPSSTTTSGNIKNIGKLIWPLEALDKEEREKRLEFFTKRQKFELESTQGEVTDDQCYSLFNKLSKKSKRKVLEPKILIKKFDSKKTSEVLENCPDLQFDRLWFSYSEGALVAKKNSSFNKLSIKERDEYADYLFKFGSNFEFYDLSEYFDEPIWGTYAEGGLLKCKNEKSELCSKLKGPRRFGFSVGAVFNKETCDLYADPRLHVGQRIIVNARESSKYKEKLSTFAFVEIENVPYRLSINSYTTLSGFNSSGELDLTNFVLESLSSEEPSKCIYSAND